MLQTHLKPSLLATYPLLLTKDRRLAAQRIPSLTIVSLKPRKTERTALVVVVVRSQLPETIARLRSTLSIFLERRCGRTRWASSSLTHADTTTGINVSLTRFRVTVRLPNLITLIGRFPGVFLSASGSPVRKRRDKAGGTVKF